MGLLIKLASKIEVTRITLPLPLPSARHFMQWTISTLRTKVKNSYLYQYCNDWNDESSTRRGELNYVATASDGHKEVSPVALKLSKFFFSSSMLRVYWSVLVVVRGKAAAVGDGYSFYCDSLLSSDWTLSLYTADSAGVHQEISYHTSNWKIFKSKYVIFWAISYNSTENL